MKFGYFSSSSVDVNARIKYSIIAEKCGFDFVWTGDHFIGFTSQEDHPEPWLTLAAIGSRTKRVVVATGVTDPYRRHPALLAHTVATLHNLLGGRVVLGLGSGEPMNLNPFGIQPRNGPRILKEAIEVVRMLWDASPTKTASFSGKIFRLKNAFLQQPLTPQQHPPIYVAATGPLTRRIAAEQGDGWLTFLNTPKTLQEDLKDLKVWLKKSGKNIEDFDVAVWLPTAVSTHSEDAKESISRVGRINLVFAQNLLPRFGFNIGLPSKLRLDRFLLTKQSEKELFQAAEKIPLEAVEMTMAFGTPDDCIAKIEDFIKAGAKSFVMPIRGPVEESLNHFKQKIIPYFNETDS